VLTALPYGTLIEYGHDPLGRRIAKKVDGVIVEKYLWQGMTRLLAVYDESGGAGDNPLQVQGKTGVLKPWLIFYLCSVGMTTRRLPGLSSSPRSPTTRGTMSTNTRDLGQKTLTGDCPNDYLPYLVENEVPFGV